MKENKGKNKKAFIRDGRAPIPKRRITSEIMSRVRAKNTTPELILRSALTEKGLTGYRLHYKKVPGSPDICYPRKKIAIFVNGCFWHRCPHCGPSFPKTNVSFWRNKFEKNVDRDKNKIKLLKRNSWKVIVIWECQIYGNIDKYVNRIEKIFLNSAH